MSHPNVLDLVGVPDTLEDGKFSTISEWMANGNIMAYVLVNAGNHLKLVGYNRVVHGHYLPAPFSSQKPLKD